MSWNLICRLVDKIGFDFRDPRASVSEVFGIFFFLMDMAHHHHVSLFTLSVILQVYL